LVIFIPPMLCSRLENPARLTERRYIAEPKLDGQRAQVHVLDGGAVAFYSRPGHDLLRHPGVAWLHVVEWPMAQYSTGRRALAMVTRTSTRSSRNATGSAGT